MIKIVKEKNDTGHRILMSQPGGSTWLTAEISDPDLAELYRQLQDIVWAKFKESAEETERGKDDVL